MDFDVPGSCKGGCGKLTTFPFGEDAGGGYCRSCYQGINVQRSQPSPESFPKQNEQLKKDFEMYQR